MVTRLNKKYLEILCNRPLLTKSVTAAILALLNESIASLTAKTEINHNRSLLMCLYGGVINAPIAHYSYQMLNNLVRPSNKSNKFLQLLLQLVTIAPLISSIMIGYITLINNSTAKKNSTIKEKVQQVITSIRQNLFKILKSSWSLNIANLLIAQNFLKPELWVVFFNFNFFILGTYQNYLLKLRLRKEQTQGQNQGQEAAAGAVQSTSTTTPATPTTPTTTPTPTPTTTESK